MQGNSILELKSYIVKKINFQLNESYDFSTDKQICINPSFRRDITKIDLNTVIIGLSILIKDDSPTALPFLIDIQIEGVFGLENWESVEMKSFIEMNSIAILFPYLRALVTMVTANTNMMPYILPVMNITALFDDANKENTGDI